LTGLREKASLPFKLKVTVWRTLVRQDSPSASQGGFMSDQRNAAALTEILARAKTGRLTAGRET
jgi:hypothetical protein